LPAPVAETLGPQAGTAEGIGHMLMSAVKEITENGLPWCNIGVLPPARA